MRLTRLALEGTQYNELSSLFAGPTAIAYSEDPVAAPKVAVNFAKENDNLVVLGGAFGPQLLDVEGVTALARLPSLDELRGRIIGMLNTPATRIAGVLQAPGGTACAGRWRLWGRARRPLRAIADTTVQA